MALRLVSISVISNDLERLNSLFCVISPNLVALGADYVKVVEDRPITPATKMYHRERSQRNATYILANTFTPCSAISLRQLNYLFSSSFLPPLCTVPFTSQI